MQHLLAHRVNSSPWNKGKITGQKPPLKRSEIWAIRVRLQIRGRTRDLALFNLAIDSKLRACDLVKIRVRDVTQAGQVANRTIIMQRKTKRPVQFEIMDQTRLAVGQWISLRNLDAHDFLFPSRINLDDHISTRQYAKLLKGWVADIGPDPERYGTHSLRRTKATLIYRRTKNLRAVQLLLVTRKLQVQCVTWVLNWMMHWKLRNKPKSDEEGIERSSVTALCPTTEASGRLGLNTEFDPKENSATVCRQRLETAKTGH